MKTPLDAEQLTRTLTPPLFSPTASVHPIETSESPKSWPLVPLAQHQIDKLHDDLDRCTPAPFHALDGRYNLEPATPGETAFRHDGWSKRRSMVLTVLRSGIAGKNRLDSFLNCGSGAQLYFHKTELRHTIVANYCHDRFCWPCATARSRLIAKNLREHIKATQIRFITLTLRSSSQPVAAQIDRLYRSFKALRCDPWWKDHTAGGAAFLEVTLNDKTLKWHPHLHVVHQGQYLPQSVLSRKWLGVTGDSMIVDIGSHGSIDEILSYVTKYASKPLDNSVFHTMAHLSEMITSMGGRRMCLAFGSWQGLHLTKKTTFFEPEDWKYIARLQDVIEAAHRNELWATAALNSCKRNCTWTPKNSDANSSPSTTPSGLSNAS